MKTLKQEEVDGCDYHDIRYSRREIGDFIEQVYNWQRFTLGWLSTGGGDRVKLAALWDCCAAAP